MGLHRRVFMEIIRRPFRAVILALMILSLSLLSMVGVFLQELVKNTYEEYVKIDGFSIAIEKSDIDTIPNELNSKILSLEHVIGYNNNGNYYDNYKPVNFRNVPYDNSTNNLYKEEVATDIRLYANINTSFYDSFRNGEMVLVEGVFPDSDNKGVIVDEMLAKENHLNVGDNIELYNVANDNTVKFKIVGFYRTLIAPEIGLSNKLGTYYIVSPYSYIFCDYESFFTISNISSSLNSVVYYVDEYNNMELVFKQIEDMVIPEGYIVINCLENTLSYYGQVIFTLKNTTSSLLGFTYITSLFILFLMTLLWMRSHYYETGIYIALGTEKRKIVLYFMLEIFTIAIISLLLSFLIGYSIIYENRTNILNFALGFTNSKFLIEGMEEKVLKHAFSFQSLLIACGIYLSVVLLSTLLSSSIITRYNPRKLFDNQ